MTDTDKMKLIEHIVVDSLEFGENSCSEWMNGILSAIASICDYKEKENA